MWKVLKENSLYEISEKAVVRYVESKHTLGGTIYRKRRVVMLRFGDHKRRFDLDRLVAEHYCENADPQNQTAIYHVDGNPMNCNAANLVWMSKRDKNYIDYRKLQDAKHLRKQMAQRPVPVNQYTMEHELIASYPSMAAAHRATDVRVFDIRNAAYGKCKQGGGFIWEVGSTTDEQNTI